MKVCLLFILLASILTAYGQTTKNLSQFTELPEAPAPSDWIYLWDTSAGISKKISRSNLLSGATINDLLTNDEAYGAGWNGKLEVPTMNAVYDKIETLVASSNAWSSGTFIGTGTYSAETLYTGTLTGAATITLNLAPGNRTGFILAAPGVSALSRTINFTNAYRVGYGGGSTTSLELTQNVDNYVEFYYDGTDLFVFFDPPLGGSGLVDNDYGDITVSGGGTVMSIDENFQPLDSHLTQLVAGTLEFPLILDEGYTTNGPSIAPRPAMVGTSMDLTKFGETYSATANATLAFIGTPTEGQIYVLVLNANAGGPYTIGFPSSFDPPINGPTASVSVPQSGSVHLTFLRESSRWVVFGVPPSTTGSGNYVLATSPTIATPTITGAIAFPDGVTQIFNPNATTPGLHPGALFGDPSAATDGAIWFNATTNKLMSRESGVNVELSGGGSALTNTYVGYGAGGVLSGEAAFSYDSAFNVLTVGAVNLGGGTAGWASYGASTLSLDAASTEKFTFDLATSNTVKFTTDSGITTAEFVSMDVKVPTEVYDATGWNGDLSVPTKDAVRDKIEALAAGSAGLTATYVGYGDGANALTGEAGFEYNASTNTLSVPNMSISTLDTSLLNVSALKFEGATADAFETQVDVEDPTADRTWTIPNVSDTFTGLAATQTLTNKTISGASNTISNLNAGLLTTGTVPTARLGTGTADSTTYLRGDGSWQTPSGGSSPTIASMRDTVVVFDDFMIAAVPSSGLASNLGLVRTAVNSSSTTGGPIGATDTTPGVIAMNTGTNAAGGVGLTSSSTGILLGSATWVWETRVRIDTLISAAAQEFDFRCGFMDAGTGESADAVYFLYNQADASWRCVTRSGSAGNTPIDSAVDVAANTWYTLRIEINAAGTSAQFFINGSSVGTETTNMPNTSSDHMGYGVSLTKTLGTTNIVATMDYMGYEMNLTTSR